MLEKAMKEHRYQESSLLEILHKAQELYGYIDKDLLAYESVWKLCWIFEEMIVLYV